MARMGVAAQRQMMSTPLHMFQTSAGTSVASRPAHMALATRYIIDNLNVNR